MNKFLRGAYVFLVDLLSLPVIMMVILYMYAEAIVDAIQFRDEIGDWIGAVNSGLKNGWKMKWHWVKTGEIVLDVVED